MKVSTYVFMGLAVLALFPAMVGVRTVQADSPTAGVQQTIERISAALREAYYADVDAPDPERVFEQYWPELRAHVTSDRVQFSSMPIIVVRDCEAYCRIIALGPRGLPFIVRQTRAERHSEWLVEFALAMAWQEMSGFVTAPCTNPWSRTSLKAWWEGGQALSDERFAEAYADDNLEAIILLGVAVLPRVMEKLEGGRLPDAGRRRAPYARPGGPGGGDPRGARRRVPGLVGGE